MEFRLLERNEINDEKWDECVNKSIDSRYYALTKFLDSVADCWAGVVWADYEAVMPIVYKKIYWFKIVVQPLFCQQLGVYSSRPEFLKLNNSILEVLNKNFFVVCYAFNTSNTFQEPSNLVCRNTDELIVKESYEQLEIRYSKNHKKNILRAKRMMLHAQESDNYELFYEMLKSFYVQKGISTVKEHNLTKLLNAIKNLSGRLYIVLNNKKEIVLAAYLIKHGNTSSFITANTDEGYYARARYFVIDQFIQFMSHTNGTIDFAGSDIETISLFNHGFGSCSRNYYQYQNKRNKLFLTFFKKIIFWKK